VLPGLASEALQEPPGALLRDEVYDESWARGPTRWLLLPSEQRQVKRLRSAGEWAAFIDSFWRRRDPTPTGAGNPARDDFRRRVLEADTLFTGDKRGSLTPQGRSYLLLGAPSHISQEYQPAPGWNARLAGGTGATTTDQLLIEIWRWRPEDLTPALRAELARKDWRIPLETRFVVSPQGYKLLEGETLLRLATRAQVLRAEESAPSNSP
jgi:GWxTD domain-containing protein